MLPDASTAKTEKLVYLIKKDGKYLSRLFPVKFGETEAKSGLVYYYESALTANDVANRLGALVEMKHIA